MGQTKNGWTSKNGYAVDEVTSALQKCIRRGEEELAGFWAMELVDSGYWKYLFHRLSVIASEDIGLADPNSILMVDSISQTITARMQEAKARGREWMAVPSEPIGFLILYLCRAPKSRVADDFITVVKSKRKTGWRPEVPAYAIDQHTKQGKEIIKQKAKENKTTQDEEKKKSFYLEGALLDNPVEVPGIDWSELLFKELGIEYTNYQK